MGLGASEGALKGVLVLLLSSNINSRSPKSLTAPLNVAFSPTFDWYQLLANFSVMCRGSLFSIGAKLNINPCATNWCTWEKDLKATKCFKENLNI